MAQAKKTMFKKGELDFKKILFLQLDRTMRALTEGNYAGFVDGVEGIYILLINTAESDTEFKADDKKLLDELQKEKPEIDDNIMLWPEDRQLMLSALGLKIAKQRLANLVMLAGRHRLLLEQRTIRDETGEEVDYGELTDEEIQSIIEDSSDEEEN